MAALPFFEVDVFSRTPFTGNPLGVIANADALDSGQMQRIAAWTNFSETTFILQPRDSRADYSVRIFTPREELPFAGHPTLGTAQVWLEQNTDSNKQELVQECAAGLITLRQNEGKIFFATPERTKTDALTDAEMAEVLQRLNLHESDVVASSWGVNGPLWRLIQLKDAQAVRDIQPSAPVPNLRVGAVGLEDSSNPYTYEIRAFNPGGEDPVTGSLHGAMAQWMRERAQVPACYTAQQGSQVGRAGEIFIEDDGTNIWVGGFVLPCVRGEIRI